jgi:hypothetical protein
MTNFTKRSFICKALLDLIFEYQPFESPKELLLSLEPLGKDFVRVGHVHVARLFSGEL